jgi:hypothetical protein
MYDTKSSKNLLKLSRVFDNENVICFKNIIRQENSFSGEKIWKAITDFGVLSSAEIFFIRNLRSERIDDRCSLFCR